MSTVPAELSQARIDALLSLAAETCAEGIEEARGHMKAAPDAEAFERASRGFNGICRSLRQTIAMKQRVDRERVALATMQARAADDDRDRADTAHRKAIEAHKRRVHALYNGARWHEYELADADECDLSEADVAEMLSIAFIGHLSELAERDDFLDTPIEVLVQHIADALQRSRPDETVNPFPVLPPVPRPAQAAAADPPPDPYFRYSSA